MAFAVIAFQSKPHRLATKSRNSYKINSKRSFEWNEQNQLKIAFNESYCRLL